MLRSLAAGLALLAPVAVSAQFWEPDIQVQKLSGTEYPSIAEDEASILDFEEFYSLKSKASSINDVAVIRVVFKGRWYKSADYLAREKAASLGANALVRAESLGSEELGAGAVRSYRAFRLTNPAGRPIFMKLSDDEPPLGAVRNANSAQTPQPSAVVPVAAHPTPKRHRHFDWVWAKDDSVLRHRLGFDVSLASKDQLEQLGLYVQENFAAGEYRKLVAAYERRSVIMLDFVKGAVR
jgi:hypothetical protein